MKNYKKSLLKQLEENNFNKYNLLMCRWEWKPLYLKGEFKILLTDKEIYECKTYERYHYLSQKINFLSNRFSTLCQLN